MKAFLGKETLLNLLLAVLVIFSLVLSVQVWYPGQTLFFQETQKPSLQRQPPPSMREMPEIFRPEQILVRDGTGSQATIHTGSPAYSAIWLPIKGTITGLRVIGGAYLTDPMHLQSTDAPWIQLHLPIPLMVSQWADLWEWDAPGLRNGSIWVDRVTLSLAEPASVYLSGPLGVTLRLSNLDEEQRQVLTERVQQMDTALFTPHRPLELAELGIQATVDLQVPMVDQMPLAQVNVGMPDAEDEEARYFPDLSVVRQIDEKDARSLTDGQSLLRVTSAGVLQYRTVADSSGTTPNLEVALGLVQQWVGSRGGWPQDVVLRRYVQQPGRGSLEFELRTGGDYPVESSDGAMQVDLSAQRVVYFSRIPAITDITFADEQQAIIAPEEALSRTLKVLPQLASEPVRSMHLAYLLMPSSAAQWSLAPSWVIQAAGTRVYVSAGADSAGFAPQVVH